jgi:catechol 2,3-dioxygenase-like lactoylglutathione lyase family enzyme
VTSYGKVAAGAIGPEISGISPFFIVQDAAAALSFYRDRLGFEITFQEPADDPFFGIVCRDGAMIMLKAVGVDPLPTANESLRRAVVTPHEAIAIEVKHT